MLVTPGQGRATIEEFGSELKIVIPTKKHVFICLFLAVWLGGWFMGEVFALREVVSGRFMNGPGLFIIFWLCGWTVGGGFAVVTFLWNLAGREIISVTSDRLKVERKVFAWGFSKEYLLDEARNFRVLESPTVQSAFAGNRGDYWGFSGGTIAFDYGMKTYRFGGGIDPAEANFILGRLKERGFLPNGEEDKSINEPQGI